MSHEKNNSQECSRPKNGVYKIPTLRSANGDAHVRELWVCDCTHVDCRVCNEHLIYGKPRNW